MADDPFRALVLEDDPDSAEFLRIALGQHAGMHVDVVGVADEALARLARETYDVLVTDIQLPGRSGLSILSEVRALDLALTVMVVTAYPTFDNALEALREAADDFLVKPVAASVVVERATLLAARSRERRSQSVQRVLAVGAHPDDVEIGVGATLAAHAAAGDPPRLRGPADAPAPATRPGARSAPARRTPSGSRGPARGAPRAPASRSRTPGRPRTAPAPPPRSLGPRAVRRPPPPPGRRAPRRAPRTARRVRVRRDRRRRSPGSCALPLRPSSDAICGPRTPQRGCWDVPLPSAQRRSRASTHARSLYPVQAARHPSVARGAEHPPRRTGPLAQLAEQRTFNPRVVGSIPTGPT